MPLLTEKLGSLTISSGGTTSAALSTVLSAGQLKTALGFLDALTLYSPQGLAEDITIQLSPVDSPTATDWIDYGLINTSLAEELLTEDLTVILTEDSDPLLTESLDEGGISLIDDYSFKDLRLVASSAVAANRTFILLAKLLTPSGW